MKHNRRLLSLLIAICLVIGLVPVAASANQADQGPSVIVGDDLRDFSLITYGGNEWIVLDADAGNTGNSDAMLLLSKELAATALSYNENGKGSSWSGSSVQAWIASYLEGYSADAQSVMLSVTKAESANAAFGVQWSADALSDEKMFFLSAEEVSAYFGENGLAGTDYVTDTGWWLRSVNADRNIMAGAVSDAGFVGAPHVAKLYGARPAVNVSNYILLATKGEKPAAFQAVSDAEGSVWTPIFVDKSLPYPAITAFMEDGQINVQKGYESLEVPVSFEGAAAGDRISAALLDQNENVLYYGPVHTVAEGDTSCTISIPAGLGGKYTLMVFTEHDGDGISFAGEACTAEIFVDDGMGQVDGWNLNLNDNISAKFYLNIPDTIVNSNAYVEVEVNGVTEKYALDGSFTTNGVGTNSVPLVIDTAAAQMTDEILITIVDDQGNRSNTYQYSVRRYAEAILSGELDDSLEKDPVVTKNLVKAMLNYGAMAQQYFGYNLNDLANDGVECTVAEVPNLGLQASIKDAVSGVTFVGASLVHESRTAVRFYFQVSDGKEHSFTYKNDPLTSCAKDGKIYVEIEGISPHMLNNSVSVIVDDVMYVEYGPMYYISRMYHRDSTSQVLKNLLSAMYNYYLAGDAYFSAS